MNDPRRYDTTCTPEMEQWYDKALKNKGCGAPLLLCTDKLLSLRKKAIQLAAEYTSKITGREVTETNDNPSLIIATGHQPIIYHMGILEKALALTRFKERYSSEDNSITALNIIIDIDEGNISTLSYPKKVRDKIVVQREQLANDTSIGFLQGPVEPEKTASILSDMAESISSLGLSKEPIEKMLSLFQEAKELPLRDLNTSLRKHMVEESTLDLPFSTLLDEPEIQGFFLSIIKDFKAFHSSYNSLLDQHRQERKIKNKANPFPNLKESGDALELPLWLYDKDLQTRSSLYVAEDGETLVLSDGEKEIARIDNAGDESTLAGAYHIYPKAVFTSIILRYFLSDLFIHGLGGEHYDRFTDKLLTEHFGVPIKEHAIVSASYSLFPNEFKAYKKQQEMMQNIQTATNKPETFFGRDIFPIDSEEELRKLQTEKEILITGLKTAQNDEERHEYKTKLNDVRNAIKEIVLKHLTPENPIDDLEATTYSFREFPYFLFC